MVESSYCQLQLTCESKKEATKIAKKLLDLHLIACAKQMPITSDFSWNGKIDYAEEVLLLMESKIDSFEATEKEVKKLHSYETFVLTATPILKISKDASKWINEELR